MSLKIKVYLIGLIPLCCFLALGGIFISDFYQTYKSASLISKNMKFSKTVSYLIHETQKERGVSAAFLNGTIALAKVEDQRKSTDKFLDLAKTTLGELEFDKAYFQEFSENLKSYASMREGISSKKSTTQEAIKELSQIIEKLIEYHSKVAESSSFGEISSANLTLLEVESTKELAGQFRAIATAILSKDAPISSEILDRLQTLVIGMSVKINSKNLSLSENSKKFRKEFFESKEWVSSLEAYEKIKTNYVTGKYQIPADIFLQQITGAINLLDKVIKAQLSDTEQAVAEREAKSKKEIVLLSIIFLIVAFVVAIIVIKTSKKLSDDLVEINKKMGDGIVVISDLASGIEKSSISLASSADEQAASVQETSASMNEIEAMIMRNNDDAQGSVKIAKQTYDELGKGVISITEITQALIVISSSNENLRVQIQDSNEKFSDIAKLIKQIGEKTSVINDIVFQTKLLSFNASVEAARAGEHGKGFAVVAEEVGNLAQMSGNASHEIYQMLESSIQSVEKVVEDQKQQMSKLITSSEKSISSGVSLASKLEQFLKELLPKLEELRNRVDQISLASSEQLKGVNEVGLAIEQVNEAARNTSEISNESSKIAIDMNSGLNNFLEVVKSLEKIIKS